MSVSNIDAGAAIRECVDKSRKFESEVSWGGTTSWPKLVELSAAACSACLNNSAAGDLRRLLLELHQWDGALMSAGALPNGLQKGQADFRPKQLRSQLYFASKALSAE